MRYPILPSACVVCLLLCGSVATAQTVPVSAPAVKASRISVNSAIRDAVAGEKAAAPVRHRAVQTKPRTIRQKSVGALVGAIAGFFIGGHTAAALEPDCRCDDPGLNGWIIGAPLGAIAGGILGAKFLF